MPAFVFLPLIGGLADDVGIRPAVMCLVPIFLIGAGIIADNELVRGAHGFAGEAGHTVVNPTGRPCGCGSTGWGSRGW